MLLTTLPQSIFDELVAGEDSAFFSAAFRIETGFVAFGHTGGSDPYDLYRIQPAAGNYRLVVSSDALNQLGSSGGWGALASQFNVYIRDAQGNLLASEAATGPDAYSDQIQFSVQSAGTFYVDIRAASGVSLAYAATLIKLDAVENPLAPTVTFSDNAPGIVNGSTTEVAYALKFSAPVTGLDSSDILLNHARLLAIEGSGTDWVVRVVPDANVARGAIGLALAVAAVQDAQGNTNAAASDTTQLIDTLAPPAPKLIATPTIDSKLDPQVTVQTTLGSFVVALDPDAAPVTVANFLAYADDGYYRDTLFHRVIAGFMAQGGAFTNGLVSQSPSYASISLESDNGLSNLRGTVAMARTSEPNSATSQFFVNLVDNKFLDYANASAPGYAVFGHVVSGMAVVDQMAQQATTSVGNFANVPVQDITMLSVTLSQAGRSVSRDAVFTLSDLATGGTWEYSLDGGEHWSSGQGSALVVPEGDYAAGAIQVRQTDAAANASADTNNFASALRVDATAPALVQLHSGGTVDAVPIEAGLHLVYDEPVMLGDGAIELRDAGGVVVQAWNSRNLDGVTVLGSDIWLQPTRELAFAQSYQWVVEAGAVSDEAGNEADGTVLAVSTAGAATVEVLVYQWRSHELLDRVEVYRGSMQQSLGGVTDSSGSATLEISALPDAALSASLNLVDQADLVSASVNLTDAIAILKMIVSLDVNGAGQPLSPYQALAADFDGNGVVQLTDAIGVLKHVVGLDSPEPEWRFVDELESGLATGLSVGQPPAIERSLDLGAGNAHIGVVAYVAGDVDGSFAGPQGAEVLAATYFTDLVSAHPALSLSQFGVYG